jgi:hypothetical protein
MPASEIPACSPLGVEGVKDMTRFDCENGVKAGLEYVAQKNAAILISEAPRAPARGICGKAKRNSAEATRLSILRSRLLRRMERRAARFHRHLHRGFYLASSPVALRPVSPTGWKALRPPHPWPKAGHGGVASSLFCFERDPHGLSHPFQKAKVLPGVMFQ